jgi:hypothetical protein
LHTLPEYLHLLTLPVIIGFVFLSVERFLEMAGLSVTPGKPQTGNDLLSGDYFPSILLHN